MLSIHSSLRFIVSRNGLNPLKDTTQGVNLICPGFVKNQKMAPAYAVELRPGSVTREKTCFFYCLLVFPGLPKADCSLVVSIY